ncbi:MAG TPA: hypothetical protein VG937_28685 [Polyangiaceae bacterium]|jgi:hypothetical protein|nr:hypothetical protein [Polyangiaceae bacterium]
MSGPSDPSSPPSAGDEHDSELGAEEEARLRVALLAAYSPTAIAEARHEQIVREALEDPLAEASDEELREAEALRLALEQEGDHEHARLARALGHALGAPSEESRATERALERALEKPAARANVVWVAFGVAASGLALAASVMLVIGGAQRGAPESASALARESLTPSRSLAPLLNADAEQLSASERMDRIASVRARELRQNRYAAWGVR